MEVNKKVDDYNKKLEEWKRKVDYYNYLESLGWKISSQAWIRIWKHHPDYDEDSPVTKAFEENFDKK